MPPSPFPAPPQPPEESLPWPGLGSYTEQSRGVFFGRDEETALIVQQVAQHRLTVLYGPAGSGKSSLLGAGCVPALRSAGVQPLLTRLDSEPGGAPFAEQIRELLARLAAADDGEEAVLLARWSGRRLAEILDDPEMLPRDWTDEPRVLILDQFEEVFPFGRAGARRNDTEELFAALADLTAQPPLPGQLPRRRRRAAGEAPAAVVRVLLSIREDFLPRLDPWRRTLPELSDSRLRLAPLTGPQAVKVITAPRAADGEPLVAQDVAGQIVRLVSGCAEDTDISVINEVPPLLSLVCRELSQASPGARIRAEAVRERSPAILHSFYEESFAGMPPAVRAFVEDRLVSDAGRRETAPRAAMESALETAGVSAPAATVDRLIARRLLTSQVHDGVSRLELTHDRLVEVVSPGHHERAAETAKEAAEQERVRLSAERRSRRGRRLRILATAALTVLPAAAVFTWFRHALQSERAAATLAGAAAHDALAQERTRSARLVEAARDDHLRAIELIRERKVLEALPFLARALELDPAASAPAEAAVLVLASYPYALPCSTVQPRLSPMTGVIFSPDGSKALLIEGTVATLHDPRTGQNLFELKGHNSDIGAAAFAPDGQRIATVSRDRTLRIWSAFDGRELLRAEEGIGECRSIQFSGDGGRLLAVDFQHDALVCDAASGAVLSKFGAGSPDIDTAAINPPGTEAATMDRDNALRIWTIKDGSLRLTVSGLRDTDELRYSTGGSELIAESGFSSIFDAASGKMIVSMDDPALISQDGARALVSHKTGPSRLWDRATLKQIAVLPEWAAEFSPCAVNADGGVIWTDAAAWRGAAPAVMSAGHGRQWFPRASSDRCIFAMEGPEHSVCFYDSARDSLDAGAEGLEAGPLHAKVLDLVVFDSERVRVRDLSAGRVITIPDATASIEGGLSRTGQYLLTRQSELSEYSLWDLEASSPVLIMQISDKGCGFSRDSNFVIGESSVWSIGHRCCLGDVPASESGLAEASRLPENAPDWFPAFLRVVSRLAFAPSGRLTVMQPARWLKDNASLHQVIAADRSAYGEFVRKLSGIDGGKSPN